jgi:hypothetical protein
MGFSLSKFAEFGEGRGGAPLSKFAEFGEGWGGAPLFLLFPCPD